MQLHQIKRKTKNKKTASVGRGGKRGKTSGRGTKGQNARAGNKKRPEMRDIIKKLPKLRGHGKNMANSRVPQGNATVVKMADILAVFKDGESVNPKSLNEKGLVKKSFIGSQVKILSGVECKIKLSVSGCKLSESARKAITDAGGTVS